MRTISSLGDLRGKRVLVRSDFNVPLKDGVITDDGRIRAALPTLKNLTDAGAKVVIMAHLGRPKGQVDPAFSLAPVATRLAELSGVKVTLATDVVGPSAADTVAALGEGVPEAVQDGLGDLGEGTVAGAALAYVYQLHVQDDGVHGLSHCLQKHLGRREAPPPAGRGRWTHPPFRSP